MHAQALTVLLGISIGVLSGEMFLYGSELAGVTFLLGMGQIILYSIERRYEHQKTVKKFSLPLFSGIFFICIFIGVIRVQLSEEKNSFVCNHICTFEARVISQGEVKGTYQNVVVRVQGEENNSTMYDVLIRVPPYPRLSTGDELSLTGKVSVPSTRIKHETERSFDYSSYLRLRGIGSEMLYPKVEVQKNKNGKSFQEELVILKEKFLSDIFLYVNEPSASLASGMLFGEKKMSEENIETFRVAGLSHIIVLSGFNIAILIAFVLFVFKIVPLLIRLVVAGAAVVFFVLMVGTEMSIVRATLMSFIALIALLFGRQYTARQALILSLIVVTLYEPSHLLHDVSLHLSFLATAGIVYMGEAIKKYVTKISFNLYQEIIATTLCAYIATIPYIMYIFGTISLYALIANIIVLPFVPLMMLLTFFVVVTAQLSSVAAPVFGYISTLLGEGIIFIARAVEGLPFSSVAVSVSFGGMVFMYCVATFCFYVFLKTRKNETPTTNNDELFSDVLSY